MAGITGLTFHDLRGSAVTRLGSRRRDPQLGDETIAKLAAKTKTPNRE
jgi:hypothetical protein